MNLVQWQSEQKRRRESPEWGNPGNRKGEMNGSYLDEVLRSAREKVSRIARKVASFFFFFGL